MRAGENIMKLILNPMGTTGDITPFIALCISLKKLGNEVTLVVPRNGESLCKKFNQPYISLNFDYRELVGVLDKRPSLTAMIDLLDREISSPFEVLKEVARGADFIIGGARNYALQPISELYGIPYFQVWHTVQVFKSRYHTPWRFTRQNNPPWLNSLLWKIHNTKDNRIGSRFVNKNRLSLGLQPIKDYAGLYRENIILAADKILAPVPTDVKAEYIQTDYWHLHDTEDLDPAIIEFINQGSKPLYFGFGSAPDSSGDQTAFIEKIVQALDTRAIIQKGWAGLGDNIQSKRIMVVDSVPHHKLFPLVATAVHHGGAGTTHSAALAGVPQIIIPQFGDQFYWGERVKSLDLSANPIGKSKLNLENLGLAIVQAQKPEVVENARRMAEALRNRQGMDAIAKTLQQSMMERIALGPKSKPKLYAKGQV